ncbi:GGDEF domain-containing protein [Methylocaldum marinum]|nr:GGDEF domain-containing protein [Methylocaldum marinum]
MYLLFQNLLQSWIRRDAESYIPLGRDCLSGRDPGILQVGQAAANSSIKTMQATASLQKGIVEQVVRRFSLYALLTICWLLIACVGLAFAVFLDIQRENQRFSEASALVQTQLVSQARRYVDATHSLAAFLKVQEPLNREKINSYSRLIAGQDAGIYFMGAVPKFEKEALDEFVSFQLHEAVDSDPVSVLRNAFQHAFASGKIVASRSFLLGNGDRGYALVEPVTLADGESFAVVICRIKALFHLPSSSASLALTLFESERAGRTPSHRLIHADALPATPLETALFPKLQFRSSFGEPEKHFLLEIEQQLGWANLDWYRLNLIFVGSLAFLLVFLSVARVHDRYEKRKLEEDNKLFMMANFDPLTGLPNRQLFMDRLDRSLADAHRSKRKVALIYLDLDGFKQVNDFYGHQTGDRVLQRAARIFQHSIRETDTVGRLGGDEFVVLLQNVGDRSGAEAVASKIKKAFFQPFVDLHEIDKIMPVLGTSVGIAVFPEDGSTTAELLRSADQAMYRDKAVGKSQQGSVTGLQSLDCHSV